MTQPASQPLWVLLCNENSAGHIMVGWEAYLRFNAEMDKELALFDARWAHLVIRQPPAVGRMSGLSGLEKQQ